MKKIHEIADKIQEHFDELYREIINSDFKHIDEIENINGIYVFYEKGKARYVGRTNRSRMKKRIQGHSSRSSHHSSASFAFRIAKETKKNLDLKKIDTYDPDFLKAKERVEKMKIKIVMVNDPIIQTMFEPYLAYRLKTKKYNTFMTH